MGNGSRVERWPVASAPSRPASHHIVPSCPHGGSFRRSCPRHHKIHSPVSNPTGRAKVSYPPGWGESPFRGPSTADRSPSSPCTPSPKLEIWVRLGLGL